MLSGMHAEEPNLLALQAWGKFPDSALRRRWAFVYGKGIVILYCAAVVLVLFYAISVGSIGGGFRLWWMISTWFCVLIPFCIENRHANAQRFWANYHDYRLAGFSGKEIILGMMAPQLAGIRRLRKCLVIIGVGLVVTVIFPAIALSCVSILLCCTYYNLALWTKSADPAPRRLGMLVIVFTSPMTLVGLYPQLFVSLSWPIFSCFFLEILVAAVRIPLVVSTWDEAIHRLEHEESLGCRCW